jgi:hypothetical protein
MAEFISPTVEKWPVRSTEMSYVIAATDVPG